MKKFAKTALLGLPAALEDNSLLLTRCNYKKCKRKQVTGSVSKRKGEKKEVVFVSPTKPNEQYIAGNSLFKEIFLNCCTNPIRQGKRRFLQQEQQQRCFGNPCGEHTGPQVCQPSLLFLTRFGWVWFDLILSVLISERTSVKLFLLSPLGDTQTSSSSTRKCWFFPHAKPTQALIWCPHSSSLAPRGHNSYLFVKYINIFHRWRTGPQV